MHVCAHVHVCACSDYMPPEVLTPQPSQAKYDASAWDVYSLAVILWQMWYRTQPFTDLNALQILYLIATEDM